MESILKSVQDGLDICVDTQKKEDEEGFKFLFPIVSKKMFILLHQMKEKRQRAAVGEEV